MIRIQRTDESTACPELAEVRNRELARVRDALKFAPLSAKLLRHEYDIAKSALYAMQHHKCCYCERIQDPVYEHVEHYRPKTKVRHAEGLNVQQGYWWLTWTWNNLLFACGQCNPDKSINFWLVPGSKPLAPEQQPPGDELPLLLDPCSDDPREHIQFLPIGGTWMPFPRNGSPRGLEMLKALQLYHPNLGARRTGLMNDWRNHAQGLQPYITRMRDALRSNSYDEIQSAWRTNVEPHLFVSQEFVALSLDVFDDAFPSAVREAWGLSLEPLPLPR